MVSEPKMVTQLLDRQMYPDSIDKAPLYNMMDQASTLCGYCTCASSRIHDAACCLQQAAQRDCAVSSKGSFSKRSANHNGAPLHRTSVWHVLCRNATALRA